MDGASTINIHKLTHPLVAKDQNILYFLNKILNKLFHYSFNILIA